jgi:serine protease SohB
MQTFADWVQFSVSAAVVLLLLTLVVLVLVLILKRTNKAEKSTLAIENLNASWKKTEDKLKSKIMPAKAFEALHKEQAKQEKEKENQEKKQKKKANGKEKYTDNEKPRVFVIDFDGDIGATRNTVLREHITAIIAVCRPQDEVVVRIESPGGMVHAYGLASSQIARLTERKIKVTACVDKVAASGGYMMACVANRIVAAPFSIIGSIGAVSAAPNFHRLLKKHDIDYIEQTAGEHKRTLSLFGEITEAGKAKHQEQLNLIHRLFKDHVAKNRPNVDLNAVATGEYWPASVALELGLVDELRTSDDLILELGKEADVYLLKTEEQQDLKTKLMKQFLGMITNSKLPFAGI